MFQAWRDRKRGLHANGLVGIEISSEGIAIAQVEGSGEKSVLRVCDFTALDQGRDSDDAETVTGSHLQTRLQQRVQELGLQQLPVNWLLNTGQYHLLLVEAPNVAEEELREAMRWRVQDLSPVPIGEATLDVFHLPEDGTRGGAKMVYAVVAQRGDIENVIADVRSAQLILTSIDIGEMGLRNIVERVVEHDRSTAIVRFRQGGASLALVRREKLYLSRQFDLAYNGGLFDELPEDSIILELQRSLDYFERQMGQVPPAKIIFCGDNVSADKITDNLRQSLPGEPVCLQPEYIVDGTEQVDPQMMTLCLGALGAALRKPVLV